MRKNEEGRRRTKKKKAHRTEDSYFISITELPRSRNSNKSGTSNLCKSVLLLSFRKNFKRVSGCVFLCCSSSSRQRTRLTLLGNYFHSRTFLRIPLVLLKECILLSLAHNSMQLHTYTIKARNY